jgi:hypothetical protein
MTLGEALKTRYPHNSERSQLVRKRLEEVCSAFVGSGHGDGNAVQRLCSADDSQYWQQLSEVLIATQLLREKIQIAHPREGPDFVFDDNGHKVWIEVICPEPRGIPDAWTKHVPGSPVDLPHEAILLRWTAAIKEKAEKLLGKPGTRGYLDKGIVGPNDAYVIAVNGRLLRGFSGSSPELIGISQFPYAVEATFALGPLQVLIDRTTMKATDGGHQHRPLIPKPKGNAVPADTFFDQKFAPVSAIWAVDLDELILISESRPMAVVHNPLTTNPLYRNVLPAQSEYVAVDCGTDFELTRHDGRLGSS